MLGKQRRDALLALFFAQTHPGNFLFIPTFAPAIPQTITRRGRWSRISSSVCMKVMKFGGTSVGSKESILNVKRIVEASPRPVIAVVSALGGVTDQLIAASREAAAGNGDYLKTYAGIVERHHRMVSDVIPAGPARDRLSADIDALLEELRSIYKGVFLIQDLTTKTADAIVAYGERLSSLIVAALVDGAERHDARRFIKTAHRGPKRLVDFDSTNRLIREELADLKGIAIVPGFISTDLDSGVTTNLGRGGSDYTAAILAAELEAGELEIWTDVDGFMTADPRVIPTAYSIDALSYGEAMELCNFGAKVVYPPTIYPVCVKNIPIRIKNTFHPDFPGSVIRKEISASARPIRGISSVNETSMVTVSGLSMVGVIGVNRRIFTTLAEGGISVFMVAQTSSETSTSICMTAADARRACRALDKEFAPEIAAGAMYPAKLDDGLSTVAVVGERMKHTPGIAGRLFGVLGRNGISVIALAQGALEMNLSFVIERQQLRKALGVIHDSFFLSDYQELNLFVCGTGTVGSSLLGQIAAQRERLMRERGLKLNLVGVASSHAAAFSDEGIDFANYRAAMQAGGAGGAGRLLDEIRNMNLFNSVFVDCTASPEIAALYPTLLESNVSVVAANKIAASSDYDTYARLKQTARERGVKFLFETNVGAGLPVINTINDLINSGDRILRIEAVLSGTLNYIFNTLSADVPLSRAVRLALENGYSEPDPRVDLSGKDVARKLAILARESGYRVETADIATQPFIPSDLFDGSLDDFWRRLPGLDDRFEAERKRLVAEGKRWRFVAEWSEGQGTIGLREVTVDHPFYNLEGSNNIILLTTERYREYPMLIQGYGAGAAVTAAGVFADIMSVANI